VKLFLKLREKIGYKMLKRKISHQKRYFRYHNFTTAKNVHILFDAQNPNNAELVKKFSDFIQQKKINVSSLGFIGDISEEEHDSYMKSIVLVSTKKINFFGKPDNIEYDEFAQAKPDILFNLCVESSFAIDYLFGLSHAEFKISTSKNIKFADFTIDVSKNQTVEFLIEQIIKYLEMIEPKNN